jgi:hypothetical protein
MLEVAAMITTTWMKRAVLIGAAALGLLSMTPGRAEAGRGWWRWHRGGGAAVVAGAVLGAAIGAAVAAPPPPWTYSYPADGSCCYQPQPPPVVMSAPPQAGWYDAVQPGLALAGVVQSGAHRAAPLGGIAAALQLRTSSHSLLAFEVQALGAERAPDGARRDELDALLAGRVYLWDAALAPYLELAGGLGRASVEVNRLQVNASQLVGRIGIGLELRLGRHLALEGELASAHRLRLDDDLASYDALWPAEHHERATEVRGGLAFRF